MYLGVAFMTIPALFVAPNDRPRIREYRTIRNGICNRLGRQAPKGLVPFSLYNFIISALSCSRFSGPLNLAWSFFISGCRRCIAIIDFVLLIVTGVRAAMITRVRPI